MNNVEAKVVKQNLWEKNIVYSLGSQSLFVFMGGFKETSW